LQALREELIETQEERQAHEALQERLHREEHRRQLTDFVRNRAAKIIQRYWTSYLSATKKAKKRAKGGKGGKGKGKGKK
jgi:hypothetical protein